MNVAGEMLWYAWICWLIVTEVWYEPFLHVTSTWGSMRSHHTRRGFEVENAFWSSRKSLFSNGYQVVGGFWCLHVSLHILIMSHISHLVQLLVSLAMSFSLSRQQGCVSMESWANSSVPAQRWTGGGEVRGTCLSRGLYQWHPVVTSHNLVT